MQNGPEVRPSRAGAPDPRPSRTRVLAPRVSGSALSRLRGRASFASGPAPVADPGPRPSRPSRHRFRALVPPSLCPPRPRALPPRAPETLDRPLPASLPPFFAIPPLRLSPPLSLRPRNRPRNAAPLANATEATRYACVLRPRDALGTHSRRSRESAPDPVRRFRQNMATKPRSGTKTPPCGKFDFTPPGHSRSPFRPQGTKSRESVPERGFVARKRSEIRTSPRRARTRRERGRGPAQPATSAASRSPRFRTRLPCTRQEAARLECAPRRAAFRKRTAELPGAPHGRAPEARRDVPTTRGASQPFAQSVVQKPRIVERPRPIRARRAVY